MHVTNPQIWICVPADWLILQRKMKLDKAKHTIQQQPSSYCCACVPNEKNCAAVWCLKHCVRGQSEHFKSARLESFKFSLFEGRKQSWKRVNELTEFSIIINILFKQNGEMPAVIHWNLQSWKYSNKAKKIVWLTKAWELGDPAQHQLCRDSLNGQSH